MAKKRHNTDVSDLRAKAEEQVRENEPKLEYLSPEEAQHLLHELSVHQVELEMQNEELRETQIELEQSQRDYVELFDDAPVGYFVSDISGMIKKINLTAAKLLNTEKDRIENKSFAVFLVEYGSATFLAHLKKVMETRTQQACVLELRRANQGTVWAKLYTIPVTDSAGKVTGFKTAILDITDISQLSR